MVPVGQEVPQDRPRPFPPAARPHRAPPLGQPATQMESAITAAILFAYMRTPLLRRPLFIHIRHEQPIRHPLLDAPDDGRLVTARI